MKILQVVEGCVAFSIEERHWELKKLFFEQAPYKCAMKPVPGLLTSSELNGVLISLEKNREKSPSVCSPRPIIAQFVLSWFFRAYHFRKSD